MSQISETSIKLSGQTRNRLKSECEKGEVYDIQESSIKLSRQTRDRLKSVGEKGETYDALINRLIDGVNKR